MPFSRGWFEFKWDLDEALLRDVDPDFLVTLGILESTSKARTGQPTYIRFIHYYNSVQTLAFAIDILSESNMIWEWCRTEELTLKCALAVVKNSLRSMRLISSALLFSAVRPTLVAAPSGFAKWRRMIRGCALR